MPGFDLTGPMGAGPRSGGGFGRCRAMAGRGYRNRRFQQDVPTMSPPAVGNGANDPLSRLEAALASIEARLSRIERDRN